MDQSSHYMLWAHYWEKDGLLLVSKKKKTKIRTKLCFYEDIGLGHLKNHFETEYGVFNILKSQVKLLRKQYLNNLKKHTLSALILLSEFKILIPLHYENIFFY
jgi:hypothetical protein